MIGGATKFAVYMSHCSRIDWPADGHFLGDSEVGSVGASVEQRKPQ